MPKPPLIRFGLFTADLDSCELRRQGVKSLWTVVPKGIYFAPMEAPKSVEYFDFASKHVRRIRKFEKNFGNGLSVSPDGRWLLYTQVDKANSDIMLVENFR
jgi:hypothetical protein